MNVEDKASSKEAQTTVQECYILNYNFLIKKYLVKFIQKTWLLVNNQIPYSVAMFERQPRMFAGDSKA